jgi:hypothetical protein
VIRDRGTKSALVARCAGAAAVLLMAHAAIAAGAPRGTAAPRLDSVTLGIFHRVFHDFKDVQNVKLGKEFILGDTEYSARVIQYVPDFMMDLKTRTIVSRSDRPENPAFRIVVTKGGVPQDTSWALFKMAPHFARKSFFGFKIVRIDFTDHTQLVADTTVASGHGALEGAPRAATSGAMRPSRNSAATKDSTRH